MLSAIAARKAAKAAAQASSSKPSSPPPFRSPSPPLQPTKRTSHFPAHARPSKNKKVKINHPSENHDPSSSSSSGEEIVLEPDIPPPVGISSHKRAWSPSRPIQDSSDEEEPGQVRLAGFPTAPTSTKPEPPLLSTFHPMHNINVFPVLESERATSGKARILVLQPNEALALVGVYSFRVLQGSLSLLGITLSPSDVNHTVFAPRSSPIPVLSWAASDHQESCAFPIPPTIRDQENTTVILVEYADTGIEGLGQICRVFDNFFEPPRGPGSVPGIDLPRIHIISHCTKDIHPFLLPSSWEAALASIDESPDLELSSAPVCLVKGPKKSGKSTLARTLVNRLLSRYIRVAFLECDLGQSEFTPGGLVALNLVENYVFGPPFSHPSLPYRAHYIGSTSPRASPSHYLHSIKSLLETYKLDLQFPVSIVDPPPGDERIFDAIPLVVNTMGWTKGLGADLNSRIEEFVMASHTFDIDSTEEKGWPTLPQFQHIPQFLSALSITQTNARRCVKVEAIHPETTNMYQTATDHRHLSILSYFHAILLESPASSSFGPVLKQIAATSWDTSLPLCAQYPYEVDYTQAFDSVYLTGPGYEDVVPSELMRVLNGAIVGLVSCGSANTFPRSLQSTSQATSLLSYTPGDPPPDPALSTCLGLALIRGIPHSLDPHSPHMHVLTPLPAGLLAQGRALVKGEMELPIWGMLDFQEDGQGRVAGVEKSLVPYLQWGKGEGVGGEKRRVRRNLMRRGQV